MKHKLTPEQQHAYFLQGFNEVMEKRAFVAGMARGAKMLSTLFRTPAKTNIGKWAVGFKKAKGQRLDYLSRFAGPTELLTGKQAVGKAAINVTEKMQRVGNAGGTLSRGIRTSVGNTAQNLKTLGEGVRGQGLLRGTGRFIKNTGTLSARQLRGARFKEINLTSNRITRDIGSKGLKYKAAGPLGKYRMFDRKVITTIDKGGRNTALVKKRLPSQVLSQMFTAPGIVASAPLLYSKDKEGKKVPIAKRYVRAIPETVAWGLARPVGAAQMGVEAVKGSVDAYKKLRPK